jgi:hypothetical protein
MSESSPRFGLCAICGRRGSWIPIAALLAALAGHGIANVLLDRVQYSGAPASVLAQLHLPALFQTFLGALVGAFLALSGRWQRTPGGSRIRAGSELSRTLGTLVLFQVLFFLGLELTERFLLLALAGAPLHLGTLGLGSVAQLAAATVSALALVLLGVGLRRLVQMVRFRPRTQARARRTFTARTGAHRALQVLARPVGVRAPPVPSP